MARASSPTEPSDRLSAVLDELDAVRRSPGWLPTEETLIDRRRPGLLDRWSSAEPSEPRPESGQSGRHRAGAAGRERIRPREPLVRAPTSFRDAEVAPSRLALIGALALVLVAALVFGGRVLLTRASAAPHPVTPTAANAVTTAGTALTGHTPAPGFASSGAATTAPVPTTPATVVVQVVGQVRKPGVVRLKSGSRVTDAVKAAGGALPSADLTRINLARLVVDGEQIHVPKPGETVTAPPAPPAAVSSAGASTAAVIDLNTADEETLETLPGVGPVLAGRIVDWRTTNGRFNSVDELGEVSGIGDKMMQQLRSRVRV